MKVRDRTGQTWRVTRRWVPWRRRLKGVWRGMFDMMPAGGGDDPLSLIIFALLALPVLVLALVAGLELLVLLLVYPLALLIRMLFGRHWRIEARRGFTIWWEAEAGSWADCRDEIHRVAAAISHGYLPPQNVDVDAETKERTSTTPYPPR